jgi:DMSO/TMAO reductase YedYZ molybdopterin-dependent catalytic subunit
VRYVVFMSIEVEASGDRQAYEHALKFAELLKSPLVRMAVEAEGVRLAAPDGHPVVYQPQREFV